MNGKVTGVGGIFIKCKDPDKMKEWYNINLGFNTDKYGAMFEFREADDPVKKGFLQWSTFPDNTKYFEPSAKDFMVNYRVSNLDALLEELEKAGIKRLDEIEDMEGIGRFAHIMDPEGNKIELWEPAEVRAD